MFLRVVWWTSALVGIAAFVACSDATSSMDDQTAVLDGAVGSDAALGSDTPSSDAASHDAAPSSDAASHDAAPSSDAFSSSPDAAHKDATVDGATPGGCVALGTVTFRTQDVSINIAGGVEYREMFTTIPSVGTLQIVLYRGAPGGFVPGTVSLACSPGAQCTGGDLVGLPVPYVVAKGTLTVGAIAGPDEVAGTLTNLELRAAVNVPVDGGGFYSVDPNGACIDVADTTFDTRASVGTSCTSHAQCGAAKVCSVALLTCAPPECSSSNNACGAQQFCDYAHGASGFCARACDPFVTCPAGYGCEGSICKHAGPATLGATCMQPSLDTVQQGCAVGLYCRTSGVGGSSSACVPTCNPFAATPGCAPSQRCLPEGYCDVPPPASSASLDQACAVPVAPIGSPQGSTAPCADDGKAFRGLCSAEGGGSSMCRRVCNPHGPACTVAGQSCLLSSSVPSTYVCR